MKGVGRGSSVDEDDPYAWQDVVAPTLADFDALTRQAFAALPADVRALCGDVVIQVEEFADTETLQELEIDNPFELSGVYQGVDLTQKSVSDPAGLPDMIYLYRRPLLDEWVERGDITLGALITHVLVHEIGHHFGHSDDDMHRIEDEAD